MSSDSYQLAGQPPSWIGSESLCASSLPQQLLIGVVAGEGEPAIHEAEQLLLLV
jgi:hypothetical protein